VNLSSQRKHELDSRIAHFAGERSGAIVPLKANLRRFGYLPDQWCTCGAEVFCPHMAQAVKLYQRFFQLDVTGQIDVATLKLLRAKRCGCLDIPPTAAQQLVSGGDPALDPFTFAFNSGPWPRYNLTYRIYNGTGDVANEVAVVDQAFGIWAAVSPLRFNRVSSGADIQVGWETGNHGDNDPFDGVGNVAAHGYYPETGVLHFDDAEGWRTDGSNVDLLNVAIHEIGHVLGLDHSRTSASIMWPFVQNGRHTLSEEDIRGILSLYPFLVGTRDRATSVHLWAFAGGTSSALVDLGRPRRFLAWGEATFVDSLIDLDRDNGIALDIFTVDGNHPARVGSGGDHLGTDGAPSNLFAGAVSGFGQRIQFRLSTFHSSDLEAYGTGCVLALD
jgi:hypothetical protein